RQSCGATFSNEEHDHRNGALQGKEQPGRRETTTLRHTLPHTGHEDHTLLLVQRHTRMVPRQDPEEIRHHSGRVGEEERRETRSETLQGNNPKRKARRRLRMQQRTHRHNNWHLETHPTKDLYSSIY